MLFAEDQFRDGPLVGTGTTDGGRAHMLTTGLDVPLSKRFVLGATFERGEVTPSGTPLAGTQPLDRIAGTAYASYAGDAFRAQVKGELREDSVAAGAGRRLDGAPRRAVAVAGAGHGDLAHRPTTSRCAARSSSRTRPRSPATPRSRARARRRRASPGARRGPIASPLLGRYTYLDEGLPNAQATNGPTDPLTGAPLGFRERAHVVSLAGDGRLFWQISLGEKVAAKLREELTPDGNSSAWMILWINRATLHVTRAWDALVEYRLLYGPGPAITHGVAIEVNRIIVGHLRLGVGWNFADFSDDETRLGDGSEKGFFVRAEGFY